MIAEKISARKANFVKPQLALKTRGTLRPNENFKKTHRAEQN